MPRTIHTAEHARLVRLLRRLRDESGLTQGELAARIGADQSFVSKYETGERRLDLVELERIAQALGISLTTVVRKYEQAGRKRTVRRS